MKQDTGKRALESYKIFPVIAWVLTFGFALFIYNLTLELNDVAKQLQIQTEIIQTQLDSIPEEETLEA